MAEVNGLNDADLVGRIPPEENELDAFTRERLKRAIVEYNREIQRFDVSPTSNQLLGQFTVSCFIINRTVASGIFTTPPIVLNGTGSVGGALMLWLASGIIALCGLMCWLELGLTIPRHNVLEEDGWRKVSTPRSGGEKNYLEYVFKRPAFFMTCGYGLLFITLGNLAANAVAFGIYIMKAADSNYDPENPGPAIGLAIAVLTLCSVVNVFSRSGGIWINNSLAIGKIACLLIITILGFIHAGGKLKSSATNNSIVAMINNATSVNLDPHKIFQRPPEAASNYLGDIVNSLFYTIFPYTGFKQPFYVLSEVARPRRVFPKATISTMLIVWLLYMLVNVSYLCVVPLEFYTSTHTGSISIAGTFFKYLFDPTGGSDTAERIISAIIAVFIFGNLMIHTFTAGRIKQEIAKEGILPFSLFFATSDATPWARLLAYIRHDRGPEAIVDMENHLEQTPTNAIWLHWASSVFLVAVTAPLRQNQYRFLVYLYTYVNIVIVGCLVAGGLLYLKLDSFFRRKKGRSWASKVAWKPWIDPLHAIVYFFVMGFLLFASLAQPSANSPFDQIVTGYPWWIVPVIGLSSLLFGVVWWFGLLVMQWRGRWRLKVRRTPYIEKDEDGNYIQKIERVEHDQLVIADSARRRRNRDGVPARMV